MYKLENANLHTYYTYIMQNEIVQQCSPVHLYAEMCVYILCVCADRILFAAFPQQSLLTLFFLLVPILHSFS